MTEELVEAIRLNDAELPERFIQQGKQLRRAESDGEPDASKRNAAVSTRVGGMREWWFTSFCNKFSNEVDRRWFGHGTYKMLDNSSFFVRERVLPVANVTYISCPLLHKPAVHLSITWDTYANRVLVLEDYNERYVEFRDCSMSKALSAFFAPTPQSVIRSHKNDYRSETVTTWLLDPLQIKISRAPYPPMQIQMQEMADGNYTIDVYCEYVILKSQNF